MAYILYKLFHHTRNAFLCLINYLLYSVINSAFEIRNVRRTRETIITISVTLLVKTFFLENSFKNNFSANQHHIRI